MKRTKLTLLLVACGLLLTTLTALAPRSASSSAQEHAIYQTNYYWFDANTNWLGRQQTLAQEIALTGFDENTTSPKTLQEKGWAPANITMVGGVPKPNNTTPDKILYSHP